MARWPRSLRRADIIIKKSDFPIFDQTMNGKPLIYLDSAASAQKPQMVVDTMTAVMGDYYANIHRGLYEFSQRTTTEFENVRGKVADFINAQNNEIIFTRNTTDAINLVAHSWGGKNLKSGDEILITALEHHANIVPWQLIAEKTGAVIKVAPIDDKNQIDLDAFEKLLSPKTKMVAISHMSNALGSVNPVKDMVAMARSVNAATLIDGSQAICHMPVDVIDLDCDFYTFTGHKLYGPSGVGVLFGKYDVLCDMPPYQGGGDMIETVGFETSTYKLPPARFEAGTPAIAEVIGLGAALDYLSNIGMDKIQSYEADLYTYALEQIQMVEGLTLYSQADHKAGVLSFNVSWAHASDLATILDQQGIAIRVGHHCAMPLMDLLGVSATARASLGLYNTRDDIDALISGLNKAKKMLG